MNSDAAAPEYSDTCVFCKVAKGTVRADIIFRDEYVVAFRDIHPQAPTHVLVIPRRHMTALWEADNAHTELLGRVILACNEVAASEGLNESGYRIVANTGKDAGQSVDHVHFHVMGGRKLEWPPG